MRDIKAAADGLCDRHSPLPAAQEQLRLGEIFAKAGASPEGQELLRILEEKNVRIIFSRETDLACYNSRVVAIEGKYHPLPRTQQILLNPDQYTLSLSASLLHEARHIQQCLGGVFRPNKQVSPFDLAWFIRTVEADAAASAMMVAFRMKLNGDDALFAVDSANFYAGMHRAVDKQYAQDPTSLHDGRLKRTAFDAWFCEKLKFNYDDETIHQDWKNVCSILDRHPYHGLQKTPLTCEDVEKTGLVGGETVNYLTLPGFRRLDDPYYKSGFDRWQEKALEKLTAEWENTFQPQQSGLANKPGALKLRP